MAGQVFDDAIFDFLVRRFGFKRPEHFVPSNKNTGIIAIKITRVGRVMHAMMRRRVHHGLKPSRHSVNCFGMNPILIDEIEPGEKEDQCWWKTEKEERHAEDETEREKASPCLPQCGGEIIVLAAVMDNMRGPEPSDPMSSTVEPIIGKVVKDEGYWRKP